VHSERHLFAAKYVPGLPQHPTPQTLGIAFAVAKIDAPKHFPALVYDRLGRFGEEGAPRTKLAVAASGCSRHSNSM